MLNGNDSEKEVSRLYKYTNHERSHELDNLLAMFYHAVYTNRVGIMQAKNEVTGDEEIILVGVEVREDGTQDCFPLAKALKAEEAKIYLAPDGNGGWSKPGKDNGPVN